MKIPSNWYRNGYRDLLNQADAELQRAHAAKSEEDLRGAIDSFCLKIGAVTEHVFSRHIQGSHNWRAQNNLFDFQQWVKGKCYAIAQLHTANTMIKHPEIDPDRHDIQLDECSLSVVGSYSYSEFQRLGVAPKVPGSMQIGERLVDTDEGPAVVTTYASPNFYFRGQKRKFVDVAEAAQRFWRAFEPAAGPNQHI
jgi:hypothetical protein